MWLSPCSRRSSVPLLSRETLAAIASEAEKSDLVLLTVELDNPTGYGRILRNKEGFVRAIVEEKDASPEERLVREVNTGIMCLPTSRLDGWLSSLKAANAQGEYYLTDVIGLAADEGLRITTVHPGHVWEVERVWQKEQARRLLDAGVTLIDPSRIDIRGSLECGKDVKIDVNCVFEGRVRIADGVRIGANCVIRDAEIGEGVHIGNFVEVKKSMVGIGTKINHLTYIGDADIGAHVNIGAGTITCNYDGVNKFRTRIGDDAFIGSGTELVAPVEVGAGATIGAGSTITKKVPEGKLTVARSRQVTIEGWHRPVKK